MYPPELEIVCLGRHSYRSGEEMQIAKNVILVHGGTEISIQLHPLDLCRGFGRVWVPTAGQ
jgi:hypothetical protein